jgi:hypothetical protein
MEEPFLWHHIPRTSLRHKDKQASGKRPMQAHANRQTSGCKTQEQLTLEWILKCLVHVWSFSWQPSFVLPFLCHSRPHYVHVLDHRIWGGPIVIVTTNGVFLPFLLAFFGFSFKFLIFVLFIDFHFGNDRYGEFSTIRHWRLWCKTLNKKNFLISTINGGFHLR